MAWEYLQDDKFDERFKPIVKFLQGKTKGKIVVDLNCGTARLCRMLEPNWLLYAGNDKSAEFILRARAHNVPNTSFHVLSDKHYDECCDILVSVGCGGYDISKEPLESDTQKDTIKRLVNTHTPEIVILEMIKAFGKDMIEYVEFLESKGYVGYIKEVKVDSTNEYVSNRLVGIFTYLKIG